MEFNKIYCQESVPFFDVNDASYWMVDKSLYVKSAPGTAGQPVQGAIPGITGTTTEGKTGTATTAGGAEPAGKTFKSVTISGKVDLENYNQIFQSFIMPFAQNNNKLDIELKIKAKSTEVSKISESSTPYKISKESAKQLGLKFEEE